MRVKKHRGSDLGWKSYDANNKVWFQAKISLYDFSALECTNDQIAKQLKKVLKNAVRLNSEFLSKWNGFNVETRLDFPLEWGLGSSATLIHLIAEWADVNPLLLHFKVSNGSGYDVACAGAEQPLVYQLEEDRVIYNEIDWNPNFKDQLYFVYLNRKQSSDKALEYYAKNGTGRKTLAKSITALTDEIISVKSVKDFSRILTEHESLVSKSLNLSPIGKEMFPDFWGATKSLGAWGGDFLLAVSDRPEEETRAYFKGKEYNTVLKYQDLFSHYDAAVPAE